MVRPRGSGGGDGDRGNRVAVHRERIEMTGGARSNREEQETFSRLRRIPEPIGLPRQGGGFPERKPAQGTHRYD